MAFINNEHERRCLIALHLTPGLGALSIARLMQALGSAAAVWNTPQEALAVIPGIGARAAAAIARGRARVDVYSAYEELRRAEECGARMLTWVDAAYPAGLRTLPDAPPVLYVRGAWRDGPEPHLCTAWEWPAASGRSWGPRVLSS
jgi:DNA processing protein